MPLLNRDKYRTLWKHTYQRIDINPKLGVGIYRIVENLEEGREQERGRKEERGNGWLYGNLV